MKIRIKIVSIITLVIMLFLMVDNVYAVDFGEIGDNNDGSFGTTNDFANGAFATIGYRYTIVRNISIQETYSTYLQVDGTNRYETGARYSWNNNQKVDNSGLITAEIKKGGTFFEEIITATKINKKDFFDNNYYIMVEVKHQIKYTTKNGDVVTIEAYAREMAEELLKPIPGAGLRVLYMMELKGLPRILQNIPCAAYIPYPGSESDKLCEESATPAHRQEYLTMAKDNSRYGKRLVYANDISVNEVKNTCESKFQNDSSIANRLELYKQYMYRNLLNFNITQPSQACSRYEPNYVPKTNCLEIDQVNDTTKNKFNSGNLSDFNDNISASNAPGLGYCLTDFELNKGVNVKYNSGIQIKAGQMILSLKENEDVVIGTLTKTCYILKNEYVNYNITKDNFITPDDYVGNVKLNGIVLTQQEKKSEPTINEEGAFYKVEGKVTISYKPNAVYGEKITGKPCSNPDSKLCTVLGYGVISNFNDVSESNASFTFEMVRDNFNKKNIFNFNGTFDCPYIVVPEIIKPNDSQKNKLQLEFRTIDTKVPFVRYTNTNWCYISVASSNYKVATCVSNNPTVTEYIINRTNSYGYKDGVKQEPIYTIELRPEDIKLIREYNKENQYNDYNIVEYLDSDTGNIITENAFLYSLRQGVLKTYKDNNIKNVVREYGTLTNKLIKN